MSESFIRHRHVIPQSYAIQRVVNKPTKDMTTGMFIDDFNSFTLLCVDVSTKGDGYQYGAVAAPDWVLPLGNRCIGATCAV